MTTAKTLPAREVMAYDDAQLDELLHQLRSACPGEPLVLDFDEPTNLSESFLERLRDRVQRDNTSSCPLDLAAIDAQLLTVKAERSPTPLLPTDEELEVQSYKQLLHEGACPAYPFELIGAVVRHPDKYHDILSPWTVGDDYMAFRNQLSRWKDFQQWQKYNRGDFEAWGKPTSSVEVELAYNHFVRFRRKFAGYTTAIQDLLRSCRHAQHRSYSFCDTGQQDRLTTWIEYLGYEHWRSSQYQGSAMPQQAYAVWHRSLLKWIAEQIPRIESELGKGTKRLRQDDDGPRISFKRPRLAMDRANGSMLVAQSRKRKTHTAESPRPLRRSARLAQQAVQSYDKVS